MTQDELKGLYSYDPTTGHFTRKTSRGGNIPGSVAGCLNQEGYITIRYKGKNLRAHRLAFLYMTGEIPSGEVDHMDHNKSNNIWDNLRVATPGENSKNKKLSDANRSGHTGVSFRNNKWIARIIVNYKYIYLGSFNFKDQAIAARQKAEIEYGFHKNHGTRYNNIA